MKNEIKKRIAMLEQMEQLIERLECMKLANSDYDENGKAIPPKEDNYCYYNYIACLEIEKMLQDLVKKI